ncbi:hypothetical protein V6N00_12935 [Tersicoccus sp. MR15.9]|uniref:hypothetical protein n=1 Tax=Tersicoccus mangrovi TaxID=3121635 RepID=UPI002FE5FC6F
MGSHLIAPMGAVNLRAGWGSFWNAITSGAPQITTLLTIVGVGLLAFALVKWAWDRRRQGMGGNHQNLLGALIPGALLCAPAIIIPILLSALDWVANIGVSLLNAVGWK